MDSPTKENIQLFSTNSTPPVARPAYKTEYPTPKEKQPYCGELKVFLGALSFVCFAKSLAQGYFKSTITQIEKRFDISSTLVGVIDGSFEMGNLLVVTLVSYFGAKLHRPKIIGAGCLVMAAGTFLIALPHFFMEPYKYGKFSSSYNESLSIDSCVLDSGGQEPSSALDKTETSIQDGCVQSVGIIGPMFGFLLGSLCAKLYVDVGVNSEHLAISPKDPQWVGAWWLGYLIAGTLSLLAAVPFWCLPKTLSRPPDQEDASSSPEKSKFIRDDPTNSQTPPGEKIKIMEMAKDFVPSLKILLGNPVFLLHIGACVFHFNSLFGMVTYKPKYIEQQYQQTSSQANFMIGLINIPAVALGMFSGGILVKKFKIGVYGAAKFSMATCVLGYLLLLSLLALGCENSAVAGLTVSYQGTKPIAPHEGSLLADCNSRCQCSETAWEPICGENGVTYMSACLAGCQASHGSGKNIILHNCSCVGLSIPEPGNSSGRMGRCQKDNGCPQRFYYFLVLSVLVSYILSLGGIPGYIIILRNIKPQLKSFAIGIYSLAIKLLAGIPAPVYFGVLIDRACLKWGSQKCGGRGSCRFYDSGLFRRIYLGLTIALGMGAVFLISSVFFLLKKNYISQPRNSAAKKELAVASARFRKERWAAKDDMLQAQYWPGKETQL
ncbi:solute carrier organic anion transporter family member 1C1 isoform X2 [Perognathus longimembris pacificus]|uniref:solute carrier organic anion transporter family member 1C1 isoform X2 n=1 Tax=Perognathus longimembris pacificus TaxID=214514 RepID=UPI002019A664|nr:solute carrier organic anion transporter family member 1C1 isoform X2 [Perognathus longimembris pacificus]